MHRGWLCLGLLLLAGCGTGYAPRHAGTPHPVFKIGAPYQVNGVWYTPRADYAYDATGIASWYGGEFNGRLTANGEIYDLNQLTAAHTTLPLPSVVEVTNLSNGRTLRLRVNDRGPFARGRILDVSRRAAQLLGFERAGTTEVRVRILRRESIAAAEETIRQSGQDPAVLTAALATPQAPHYAGPPAPHYASPPAPRYAARPQPAAHYYVLAGAFADSRYAEQATSAIAPLGEVAIVTTFVQGAPVYRVQLGPVATGAEAEQLLARIVNTGYAGAKIIVD
jgi:rare lipoprotein A